MAPPVRILLIDEHADERDRAARELRGSLAYAAVTSVATAHELDEALAGEPVELVLTEQQLSWADGLSVLSRVKEAWPDCPVLMLASAGHERAAIEAMKAGLDDYLVKGPDSYERLAESARAAMARAGQRRSARDAEHRYQRLFDNVPVGLYRTTRTGQIIEANDALVQMLGYPSRDELLAVDAVTLYAHPEDRQRVAELLERDGVVRGLELQLVRYDGASIWVRDSARQVRNASGQVTYFEGSLEDISERKRVTEQLQHTVDRLRRAMEGTIEAMALTAEVRDPHTAGHQRRVAKLATAIAERLGLDEQRVEGIRMGALIHDLGKIYVPAEILSKPGRLSQAELNLIRVHPEVGYEILKTVEFPWPIAAIVIQHHEVLDGSGYPRGLKGDDITLEARILGVSDVVEAMASHRPYRPALGIRRALEQITVNRGALYDERVVDVCLALFEKESFRFD